MRMACLIKLKCTIFIAIWKDISKKKKKTSKESQIPNSGAFDIHLAYQFKIIFKITNKFQNNEI